MASSALSESSSRFTRPAGALVLFKGALGWLLLVGIEFAYAQSSSRPIEDYKLTFFLLNLLFPYGIFLGLYLLGVSFASSREFFLNKLKSLSPSKISLRRPSLVDSESSEPVFDPKKLKLPPRSTFPEKKPVPRMRAAVLILIDLLASAPLVYSIPELSFLLIFLLFEFFFLILVCFK